MPSLTDDEVFGAAPLATEAPRSLSDADVFGTSLSDEAVFGATEAPGILRTAGDLAAGFAGSAIKSVGSGIRLADRALTAAQDFVVNDMIGAVMPSVADDMTGRYRSGLLSPNVVEGVQSAGAAISNLQSPSQREATRQTMPPDSASILSPSTWEMGPNPSVRGALGLGAELLGSMAPIVVAGVLGGAVPAAIAGGAIGGGGAMEEAGATIDKMVADGTLEGESARYRQLVVGGMSPEEAVAKVRADAVDWAAGLTTPVSALGGAITGKIVSPATGLLATKALPVRVGGRGLISGAEESVQEVSEGVATRHGTNVAAGTNIPLEQGTFGEALLGLVGGKVVGMATAGRRQSSATPPTPEEIQALYDAMSGGPPIFNPDVPPGENLRRWMEGTTQDDTSTPPPPLASTVQTAASEMAAPPVDPLPTYYSNLLRVAEERLPQSGTPEQMLATLRNTPGIKQEEIEATGLEAFLASQRGVVSRAEVVEHLEENQVRVEEVLHGGADTEHRTYVTSGPAGKYRELLLTLPKDNPLAKAEKRYKEILQLFELQGQISPEQQTEWDQLSKEVGDRRNRGEQSDAGVFKGSHWSEPNVVSHVRFTERVDRSGQRVLHIEEIQSDWHQQGRKTGYKDAQLEGRLERNVKESSAVVAQAQKRFELKINNTTLDGQLLQNLGEAALFDGDSQTALSTIPDNARIEAMDYIDALRASGVAYQQRNSYRYQTHPPDAPFKTSWPELTFKRMLRWAADNGYSRISWNNGDLAAKYAAGGVTDAKVKAGLVEFYDRIIPSMAKRWAKKLGGMTGSTKINTIMDPPNFIPASGARGWGVTVDGHNELWPLMNEQEGQSYWAKTEAEVREWISEQNEGTAPTVQYLDIPERAKSYIQQGLPLFTVTRSDDTRVFADPATVKNLVAGDPMTQAIQKASLVLAKMAKEFKLDTKIRLILKATPPAVISERSVARAFATRQLDGTYTITIHTSDPAYANITDFYTDMMHEFGHVVFWEHFARAPESQKRAILADYERFVWKMSQDRTVGDIVRRRDNAIMNLRGRRPESWALNELAQEQREYWYHFEEWMAEQVARWATSTIKPLTIAEKFYKGLGVQIAKLFRRASDLFGLNFRPEASVQQWLDSFIETAPPLAAKVYDDLDLQSQRENQRLIDINEPGLAAVPQQPETTGLRATITAIASTMPPGPQRQALQQLPAFADKFNHFYRVMTHAFQLGELNPNLASLQRYLEKIRAAGVQESIINDAAIKTLKDWDNLGRVQGENLTLLLDDVTNMNYRTPSEIARGVARHPTPAEFNTMVAAHKVSAEGLVVFKQINSMFDRFLDRSSQLAMDEAMKLTDPIARMAAVNQIRANTINLRSRPYFPFMRFGRHIVSVKNAAGVTVHREHFERRGLSSAESQQKKAMSRLQSAFPGHTIVPDILSESAVPMIGMPGMMLDMMKQKLALTPAQEKAVEQLRFELAPAQSFRHRFQNKSYVSGYSQDFKRAFSQYFFHGAKWYVKVKFADGLRQDIQDTRDSLSTSTTPTKRIRIANFMADHLERNFLNPAMDFITFKAGLVLYTLAFVPVSALVNMSQTPLVTLPFLASKFGIPGLSDVRAGKAMAKAIADWRNYYKKGAYQTMTSADGKALDYAIKTGRLDQTLAGELAAWSQGSNLGSGYGGTLPARILHETLKKGMWMFEMAEKWNRRVAFKAALDLARAHPNVRYVRETVKQYQDEIASMVRSGFPQAEAEAITVANHTVDQTQFMGTTESRPKFMRGKFGTVFLFKRFIQGLVFLGANNKLGFVPRFALLMFYVGGMHGIPGYDDAEELARVLGWWLFGKDFKLDREVRALLLQLTGSNEAAEAVLHGTARTGFGIPWLLNMMGNQVGMPKTVPTVDMSRSLSPGAILPVELGKLFGPPIADPAKMVGDQSARAAGVMGSVAMGFYKAIANTESPNDFKRWESAMPRALRNLSHSYRAYSEQRERGRRDTTIIPYNINDPENGWEHFGEAMGIAGGFQPTRLTKQWEGIREQGEIIKFFSVQRDVMYAQWAKAIKDRDEESQARLRIATKEYNDDLPEWARGFSITDARLKQSVEGRIRTQELFNQGLSPIRRHIPVLEHVQKLYGTTPVDVRRVR